MKAVLVEHKVQIPEEWQPKAKVIAALGTQLHNETPSTSPDDYYIRGTAFKVFKGSFFREVTSVLGVFYADYTIWGISDSGEELIGYRYEFQAEAK